MILNGIDIIEINRIKSVLEKYPDKFLKRIYTKNYNSLNNMYTFLINLGVYKGFVVGTLPKPPHAPDPGIGGLGEVCGHMRRPRAVAAARIF